MQKRKIAAAAAAGMVTGTLFHSPTELMDVSEPVPVVEHVSEEETAALERPREANRRGAGPAPAAGFPPAGGSAAVGNQAGCACLPYQPYGAAQGLYWRILEIGCVWRLCCWLCLLPR